MIFMAKLEARGVPKIPRGVHEHKNTICRLLIECQIQAENHQGAKDRMLLAFILRSKPFKAFNEYDIIGNISYEIRAMPN